MMYQNMRDERSEHVKRRRCPAGRAAVTPTKRETGLAAVTPRDVSHG